MGKTDSSCRIVQARQIAAELCQLMREDAVRRTGLAEAFPAALDHSWTPEFYRKCQLAERLFEILNDVTALDSKEILKSLETSASKDSPLDGKVVRHTARQVRSRLGI